MHCSSQGLPPSLATNYSFPTERPLSLHLLPQTFSPSGIFQPHGELWPSISGCGVPGEDALSPFPQCNRDKNLAWMVGGDWLLGWVGSSDQKT